MTPQTKRLFRVAVAALLVTVVTVAKAQPQPGLQPLTGVFGTQAGDYKFFQYDRGALQKQYLDQVFARSAADKEYFLSAVSSIESSFRSLLQDTVYAEKGLKWMSDQAVGAGKFFPAVEFLAAVNRFQMSRMALENRIESLRSIADALPSKLAIDAEGAGLKDVPNYGNVKFDPIVDFYKGRMKEVVAAVSNLQQNVIVANGAEHIIRANTGKSLELSVKGLALSPEKIAELRRQVVRARRWGVKAYDTINDYTVYCKRLVQNFIKTYGTTERYRKISGAEATERENDAKRIVQGFWTRSYLRAVYGMPIGAIGINYDKNWFHLDVVLNRTLQSFYEEPVWDQAELVRVAQNYRNALKIVDERSQRILDGNLSYIAAGRNLITWLAGHRNLAKAQEMILKTLAADMYEERLIMEADGLAQMKQRYRARYASTQEDRDYYRKLQKAYDPQGDADPAASIGIVQDSINGKFQDVLVYMKTKEDELAQAAEIQATIDAATGENRWAEQRKKRIDDLLGDDEKK